MFKRLMALALCGAMALSLLLTGCRDESGEPGSLMTNIQPNHTSGKEVDAQLTKAASEFSVQLMRYSDKGENLLLSPLSILYALGMTANGAQGETLQQMEQVMGLPLDILNPSLKAYTDELPDEESGTLRLANGIWFNDREGLSIDKNFLQTNADWYGAGLYQQPFSDETRDEINRWVEQHTNGMIPEILDEIPSDAVMYLVNALAFEGKWSEPYEESDVDEGEFTTEEGKKQEIDALYSIEFSYLEDENTTGFYKYYQNQDYAFVGLLPKEGMPLTKYLETMTGDKLEKLLENPQNIETYTMIPKLKVEYQTELKDVLKKIGMRDAFTDGKPDFSGLGTSEKGDLGISRVLHRTYLELDEQGTKAGATTAVEVAETMAIPDEEPQIREVYLNRPFVYLIVDCTHRVPIFIGAVWSIE